MRGEMRDCHPNPCNCPLIRRRLLTHSASNSTNPRTGSDHFLNGHSGLLNTTVPLNGPGKAFDPQLAFMLSVAVLSRLTSHVWLSSSGQSNEHVAATRLSTETASLAAIRTDTVFSHDRRIGGKKINDGNDRNAG